MAYTLYKSLGEVQEAMVKQAIKREIQKPTGRTQSVMNMIYAGYFMSPMGYMFHNSRYNAYWRVQEILNESDVPSTLPSTVDHLDQQVLNRDN